MKYTVLILYPRHVTDNFGTDTYMTFVEAESVAEAQTMAQIEAFEASTEPDDRDVIYSEHLQYDVLMVIAGEHSDIKEV